MSLWGKSDKENIQNSINGLGDVLNQSKALERRRNMGNAYIKHTLSATGLNDANTISVNQRNAYAADGANYSQMTPEEQRSWVLRGGAFGFDPRQGAGAMSQFRFLDAANNPNAAPMTEDQARRLYGAQGLVPNENTRATTGYDQAMKGQELSLARVLQDMQERSRQIRKRVQKPPTQ